MAYPFSPHLDCPSLDVDLVFEQVPICEMPDISDSIQRLPIDPPFAGIVVPDLDGDCLCIDMDFTTTVTMADIGEPVTAGHFNVRAAGGEPLDCCEGIYDLGLDIEIPCVSFTLKPTGTIKNLPIRNPSITFDPSDDISVDAWLDALDEDESIDEEEKEKIREDILKKEKAARDESTAREDAGGEPFTEFEVVASIVGKAWQPDESTSTGRAQKKIRDEASQYIKETGTVNELLTRISDGHNNGELSDDEFSDFVDAIHASTDIPMGHGNRTISEVFFGGESSYVVTALKYFGDVFGSEPCSVSTYTGIKLPCLPFDVNQVGIIRQGDFSAPRINFSSGPETSISTLFDAVDQRTDLDATEKTRQRGEISSASSVVMSEIQTEADNDAARIIESEEAGRPPRAPKPPPTVQEVISRVVSKLQDGEDGMTAAGATIHDRYGDAFGGGACTLPLFLDLELPCMPFSLNAGKQEVNMVGSDDDAAVRFTINPTSKLGGEEGEKVDCSLDFDIEIDLPSVPEIPQIPPPMVTVPGEVTTTDRCSPNPVAGELKVTPLADTVVDGKTQKNQEIALDLVLGCFPHPLEGKVDVTYEKASEGAELSESEFTFTPFQAPGGNPGGGCKCGTHVQLDLVLPEPACIPFTVSSEPGIVKYGSLTTPAATAVSRVVNADDPCDLTLKVDVDLPPPTFTSDVGPVAWGDSDVGNILVAVTPEAPFGNFNVSAAVTLPQPPTGGGGGTLTIGEATDVVWGPTGAEKGEAELVLTDVNGVPTTTVKVTLPEKPEQECIPFTITNDEHNTVSYASVQGDDKGNISITPSYGSIENPCELGLHFDVTIPLPKTGGKRGARYGAGKPMFGVTYVGDTLAVDADLPWPPNYMNNLVYLGDGEVYNRTLFWDTAKGATGGWETKQSVPDTLAFKIPSTPEMLLPPVPPETAPLANPAYVLGATADGTLGWVPVSTSFNCDEV